MNDSKSILIVGGSGGIGLQTAEQALEAGMKVTLTFCRDGSQIKKKLEKFEKTKYELFKLDFENDAELENMAASFSKKKFDAVVYSVSTPIVNKKLHDVGWKEFQKHIDVQVKGFYYLVKSLSHLVLDKAHKIKFIVILTEYCMGKPPVMLSHYVTAKYGLMGLVKSAAVEYEKCNSTFNMISPGMVRTKLISELPAKLIEITEVKNPMGRIAETKDVADLILFLISDKSDYINGANIPLNGGNLFV